MKLLRTTGPTVPDDLWTFASATAPGTATTPHDLLRAAAQGDIELLFEIPASLDPVLQPPNSIHHRQERFGYPCAMSTPQYMVLPAIHCELLLKRSSVAVMQADRAYRWTGRNFALHVMDAKQLRQQSGFVAYLDGHAVPPSDHWRDAWQQWVFLDNKQRCAIPVNLEELKVICRVYCAWKGWDPNAQPGDGLFRTPGPAADDDDDDDFKSLKLLKMYDAAQQLWNNDKVIYDDSSTHPTTKLVVAWFMNCGAGFSKTTAEAAAAIIKPAFGNRGGAPIKRR